MGDWEYKVGDWGVEGGRLGSRRWETGEFKVGDWGVEDGRLGV